MTTAQHIDALHRLTLVHSLSLSTLGSARTIQEIVEASAMLDLHDLAHRWVCRARDRAIAAGVVS